MAHLRSKRSWNVDQGYVTPEPTFLSRRTFIKAGSLLAFGSTGAMRAVIAKGADGDDDELRRTLRPVEGSAFRPCPRSEKYEVDRPVTEETAAGRFNNFYEFGLNKEACWRAAQKLTIRPWTLEVGGLVAKTKTFAIDDLIRKMPCEERLYRFRCVERWAMVVPWSGFAFKSLMDAVEPLSSAKFVRFVSFHRPQEAVGQRPGSGWRWPYYEGLTIAEAANELCFVAIGVYGHDLPRQHGAPLRMAVPWKYGYKGAKSIVRIEFVDKQPTTFWNDYAAHEYGFYSNVDPGRPHPRWPQTHERMIGTNKRYETLRYNGYGTYVAQLYRGNEE